MAALTINERAVKLVRVDESIAPARSAQALNAGQHVSPNAAGEQAPGSGPGGVCISTVLSANAPVSVVKKGVLELGDALNALAFGAPVYAAADGSLDDAAGAGANKQIGHVMAGLGDNPPKRLLYVDA